MKTALLRRIVVISCGLLMAMLPASMSLYADEIKATPPPISQPMVSEGMLAVSLANSLGIDSTSDDVVAESSLGERGIAPANGWIADYPVTPDIIAEVRQSVLQAVDSGKLSMGRDDALKIYGEVLAGYGLTVRPYVASEAASYQPVTCDTYPNPATINSVYSGEGPPVVTYYCPPPVYYSYYTWVPYPFWWSDFWFSGYFILSDFHRHARIHNRSVFITNHFNDVRHHRVFRVDPGDRFHGRSFTGIGARPSRGFISTGVPHSSHTIFNAPRGTSPAASRGMGRGMGGGSGSKSGAMGGSGGSRHGTGSGGGSHGGGGRR